MVLSGFLDVRTVSSSLDEAVDVAEANTAATLASWLAVRLRVPLGEERS